MFLGHIAYPILLFVIAAKLFQINYSGFDLLFLMFFAGLPDLDFLYHKFVKKGKFDVGFQHHKWFTHIPIFYIPLLVLLFIFPSFKFGLATYGLFSHLALDLFFGNGIMLLYPFSKKHFGMFMITDCHGHEWLKKYKKMPIYKADIVSIIIVLVILLFKFF